MNILSQTKRHIIAKRIAEELKDGQIVNLGIGIPTLLSNDLTDKTVYFETENGLLGMGPFATDEEVDIDLLNAGRSRSLI